MDPNNKTSVTHDEALLALVDAYIDDEGELRCLLCGSLNEICRCQ